MKKFKEFFVSYWNLMKESGRWVKEHWFGYTIICIVIFLLQNGKYIKAKIRWKIQERKWEKY